MDNFFNRLPDRHELENWFRERGGKNIHEVNSHIHSPYSFSAFTDLEQAFRLASEEGVTVLGINDFNTTMGYEAFSDLALKYRIYPLFNIEFMGLMKDEQADGVRINDPNNPGRIYFSGKGLDFPVTFSTGTIRKINDIQEKSQRQVSEMTEKLNKHLSTLDKSMKIDFNKIKSDHTMGMVRERHVALAVRLLIEEKFESVEEQQSFLGKLYGGKESSANPADNASVENEIRSRMLKSGGIAFVEEDPLAFPELEEIISVIRDGGGVPCYPVLLDDNKGLFTDFESGAEYLYNRLISFGISCIELIPGRNDINLLGPFVKFFSDKGFVVLFGTEHNTPALDPLKVTARGGIALDDQLRQTGYEGACIIAAHQYMRSRGEEGYDFYNEIDRLDKNIEFIKLGKAVISGFLNM